MKKDGLGRRQLLKGAAAGAALGFPMVNFGSYRLFAQTPTRYSARAIKLVERSLVIDMLGLVDLMGTQSKLYSSKLTDEQVDMFRSSGINIIHNASGIGGRDAYALVLSYIATWSSFAGRNSDLFTLISRVDDMHQAKKDKKIGMIMGLQNSEHFRTPDDVKAFYLLGQRVSQLTYNSQTLIGSGSTERVDGGISDFGASIIKAMNETGMLVDVSHSGPKTTLDAIEISSTPIAFTHSNCQALNNHPRLKSDEAIKKLAARGGVMGITGVRMFVRNREPTNVSNIVEHIDHVVKLVGIDHVGIGSDADLNGYDDMTPEANRRLRGYYKESYAFRDKIDTDGFDHPKKIYDLTDALIRAGYSDANIEAILGGNFTRLLGTIWKAPTPPADDEA